MNLKRRRIYKPGDTIPIRLRNSDQDLADFLNEAEESPTDLVLSGLRLLKKHYHTNEQTVVVDSDEPDWVSRLENGLSKQIVRLIERINELEQKIQSMNIQSSNEMAVALESAASNVPSVPDPAQPQENVVDQEELQNALDDMASFD